MANENLKRLRDLMLERDIDVYVIPTADYHESEYVGGHFRARAFMTGFTGSSGVAVVTMDRAGLWTDGRYFIQAERQLKDSGFTLFKTGVDGVPTVNEFIAEALPAGGTVGFDGRTVNAAWGLELQKIAEDRGGSLHVKEDLIDLVWEDRPAISTEKAWVLDERYAGESMDSKLRRIRAEMERYGAAVHVITSLDDIAWILNIRGNDVVHTPFVLSYLVLTAKGCIFYAAPEALTQELYAYLMDHRVSVASYNDFYQMTETLGRKNVGRILADLGKINFRVYSDLSRSNEIVNVPNPSQKMKAVKNPVEIANIRKAHVKDGVAMVRWLKWLKENAGIEEMDEVSVADKLEQFRREQEGFLDLSFGTIAAYGPNAAMMHYSARPETAAEVRPEGFLLVDSGGHYLEGSTDITRTVAMGPLTDEEKTLFTAVLRSNLNLAAAKFLYGCSGLNLDILARGPLWEMGIDYRCGTGHGVGYILNIHEGPNGFRWKTVPERVDSGVLEEGMVTTDEPGVYLEGVLGIRTENELICRRDEANEYGQFMSFETVTYCPIDLDAVDPDQLSKREKDLLNSYHKMVYNTLSPYLTTEEKLWLRYETREV